MSFNNKVVIVTGASSGIGAATAVLFAKDGADVAIIAKGTPAQLDGVAEQITAYGRKVLIIKADLSIEAEVANVIPRTVDYFGKIDVLVNAAGMHIDGKILDGKAVYAYDEVMKVNTRAIIQLTSAAAPYLAKTKGNVVNVTSVCAVTVANDPNFLPYCVSKAATNHFSRCAALELASVGVRVNAVTPGPTDNDFLANNGYADVGVLKQALRESTALGSMAKSEHIGDLILFLASDKAKSITGSTYNIDNGYLLKN